MADDLYPPIIRDLPLANIPFKGVKGHLLQGTSRQLVFFDIEPIGKIPEHSHGAQWGVILEGEVELTISGITNTYHKGDSYYIPAGAPHSVSVKTHCKALDLFAEVDRYQPVG